MNYTRRMNTCGNPGAGGVGPLAQHPTNMEHALMLRDSQSPVALTPDVDRALCIENVDGLIARLAWLFALC